MSENDEEVKPTEESQPVAPEAAPVEAAAADSEAPKEEAAPAEAPKKRGRKKASEAQLVTGDVVHADPSSSPEASPPEAPAPSVVVVPDGMAPEAVEKVVEVLKASAEEVVVLPQAAEEPQAVVVEPTSTSAVIPENKPVPPQPNRKQRLALESQRRQLAKVLGKPKAPLSRVKIPKGFRGR